PVPTAMPSTETPAMGGDAKYGGILQWAGLSDSPHFDMHQCNTAACAEPQGPFFDNLVRYSPFDGGIELLPDLALSWDISDDGLVYKFHLRDAVKFHDGAALTSDDIKATFDRIIFPQTGMISPRQSLFEAVSEIRVVDPLTVEFVLKAPRSFLPAAIASGWNVIERKQTIDDNNSDLKKLKPGTTEHPGTGPFILEDHQSGEFWKMKRNPNYWNPVLPYLDGIQFNHLPYGPATGAALIAGQVDYVYGAGADLRDDILNKYADTHTVVVYPIPTYGGAFINHEKGPLGDANVRKAISMVMDRCAIKKATAAIREIDIGTWIMANDTAYGPAFREATFDKKPGYRCPVTEEDIDAAQKLLADAGYPNGDGFPTLDLMVRDLNFFAAPMGPMMQAFMKQRLNINSDLRVVHTSVWGEDQARGNYDLAVNGSPTPLASVAPYWSAYFTTGSGANWNFGSSNPEFDSVVSEIFAESDTAKQAALVARGAEILEDWTPMILINHFTIIDGFANYVKGHGRANRVTLFNDIRFDTVWLDK
ncbi:MAG: ABC transporter substrate-binding protein, partial [Chloroflexi bacterium]|nr:ABC transporter substrate-binding protein [Chloroflexota bacterium]